MPTGNKVAIVDLKSFTVARTIDVPAGAAGSADPPGQPGRLRLVRLSAKVVAISIADWTIASTIDAGKGADGLAWAPGASVEGPGSGQ